MKVVQFDSGKYVSVDNLHYFEKPDGTIIPLNAKTAAAFIIQDNLDAVSEYLSMLHEMNVGYIPLSMLVKYSDE